MRDRKAEARRANQALTVALNRERNRGQALRDKVQRQDSVLRDLRAAVAKPEKRRIVAMPNGHKFAMPDHEAYASELVRRENRLAGDFLDQMDSAHPSYAVTLPAGYASLPWHGDWARFRRDYVTTGSTSALDRMRAVVTMDNPPLASDIASIAAHGAREGRPRGSHYLDASLVVMLALAAFVVYVCAAVIWSMVL
jgi:hypothetical protein